MEVSAPEVGPLFEGRDLSPEATRTGALALEGDVGRGAALYADTERLACARCHVLDGRRRAGRARADGIGSRATREELLDSLLDPSAKLTEGYTAEILELRTGERLFGMVLEREDGRLDVVEFDGVPTVVHPVDVEERTPSRLSLMPEGYGNLLTPQVLPTCSPTCRRRADGSRSESRSRPRRRAQNTECSAVRVSP